MERIFERGDEEYIEIIAKLKNKGYDIISLDEVSRRYCFNILAHRKEKTLLIRYLRNLDSVPARCIKELKALAYTLNAVPLIISSRDSRKELSNGVAYMRYGIYSVNPRTFIDALMNRPPYVYMDRGGIYVNINGNKLRRLRLDKNLSLGELADRVGVSRKAIYSYERNIIGASPEVLERLETILGEHIRKPINIFEEMRISKGKYDSEVDKEVVFQKPKKSYEKYRLMHILTKIADRMGIRVLFFERNVFEILTKSKNKNIFIKFILKLNEREVKEVRYTLKIADITSSRALFITRDKSRIRELKDITDKETISLDQVDERRLTEAVGINLT